MRADGNVKIIESEGRKMTRAALKGCPSDLAHLVGPAAGFAGKEISH
jgi:hypothetical protein